MGTRDDDSHDRGVADGGARAELRIWLGASPGVGKTFLMLENARRLRREGADVVVGVVETHGRKETAELLNGLEQLTRKHVAYRGSTLDEFDLDAALARRPTAILLDELAHTNAPGSRHAKRWQDALELLEAGIEVHSTLNIQHVESLNDVVAQITQVRVRETVPDAILERADEIELVDVPPEVVLARLREGKVYVPVMAERAAAHFFKEGNLHALRELALRATAERVDAEVRAWLREQGVDASWAPRESVMVCVGPSPGSSRLVRSARRMASALRAPLIAAYVERAAGAPLSERDRARLAAHLRLAESLGAEVVVVAGERAADALLDLARRRNVTRIVAGKPTHPRWRDFIYGSLLDDLVRGSGDIDVLVIAGERSESAPRPARAARPPGALAAYARGAIPVAVAAVLADLVREHVELADVAMLFLVAIALAAAFLGRSAALLASALSVVVFDFFFVPPIHSFSMSDLRHALTFLVMLFAGVAISTLTDRIQRQSAAARERERRTAALYALSRALAGARDVPAIASAASAQIEALFESRAVLLVADPESPSGLVAPAPGGLELGESDRTVARWALEHGRAAGRGLETLPGARVVAMPLLAEGSAVGVLAVLPSPERRFEEPTQRHLLLISVAQIALALERAQLADEARRAEVRAETEDMRSSLLSAVSHDLRTPIATVLGTATTLLDTGDALAEHDRDELTTAIRDEASRLSRLVGNLLDMTKVEAGRLELRKQWVRLDALVRVVTARWETRLSGRELHVHVPPELVVPIDSLLFEQVLANLVENALKHTPEGSPIEIRARASEREVAFEIADRGPGIPPGSETRIFEKFVRGAGSGGVGLGLAICRGIVLAHGGTIAASARPGGGAVFQVRLPLEGVPRIGAAEPELVVEQMP